jgi:diguanylate cyclase (GGDEF)-like protein
MSKKPVILIVDDEVSNIEILSAGLEEDYELSFATSGDEALLLLPALMPDLVLLDVMMPGISGYEVCKKIKADPMLADIPIIFTTALDDEGDQLLGLGAGAIDYITKPYRPAIVQARVRNHLEMKRMRDQLAELAVTDALTGLGNRRRLESILASEYQRLTKARENLSAIILDVDFFKRFNDRYGHAAGDQCLVQVAAALSRAARRAADFTVRYGGEEFACLLPSASHDEAMEVASNIRDRVQALGIPHGGSEVASFVTVSVGVATCVCEPGVSPGAWILAADQQLYLAKGSGRNGVTGRVFSPQEMITAWSKLTH